MHVCNISGWLTCMRKRHVGTDIGFINVMKKLCIYVSCFVCTQTSKPEYTQSFIDLAPGVFSPEGLALIKNLLHTWRCISLLPDSLCWPTVPHLNPPSSQSPKTFHHRIKWLQACCPDICGHEILWETGVEPPEGHQSLPAGPPEGCLLRKQLGGWCSQHGTALYSVSPRLLKDPCKYSWTSVQASICEKKKVRLCCITSSTRLSHSWPPGMNSLTMFFFLYTNDCTSGNPFVCSPHHIHCCHLGCGWVCIKTGGGTAYPLVWSESPGADPLLRPWRWQWTCGDSGEAPTDNQVCRNNNWSQLDLHSGPDTGRKHLCRPLTPRAQTVQDPPCW